MEFFIPAVDDAEHAEAVYTSIKAFAKQTLGWGITDRRIRRIDYVHDGKRYFAEVGKTEDRTHGVCIAILESLTYLVCTPERGVVRGEPILVGRNEVARVTDFDQNDPVSS